MAHDLEYPGADGVPDWGSLYRARGDEVVRHRPIFTGDVFEKIPVQGLGESKTKTVIVLQHPCALRSNGVNLHSRLMVAELRNHKPIPVEAWTGHVGKMPLPELLPAGRREGGTRQPSLMSPISSAPTTSPWISESPVCRKWGLTCCYSVGSTTTAEWWYRQRHTRRCLARPTRRPTSRQRLVSRDVRPDPPGGRPPVHGPVRLGPGRPGQPRHPPPGFQRRQHLGQV